MCFPEVFSHGTYLMKMMKIRSKTRGVKKIGPERARLCTFW